MIHHEHRHKSAPASSQVVGHFPIASRRRVQTLGGNTKSLVAYSWALIKKQFPLVGAAKEIDQFHSKQPPQSPVSACYGDNLPPISANR